MIQLFLVIHLILAISLVAVILLQRSEGGALGIGGGTMGGLMTTRGSANLLTRATTVLATCFICTSLLLAIWTSANRAPESILDRTAPATEAPAPALPAPAPPAPGPAVPVTE